MEKPASAVRSIALIGLPASGKTSVGFLLAELEGLPFIDLDEIVAQDARQDIASIFQDEGEAGFRERERIALIKVAAGGPVLLATGGGCVELAENRALLRERFTVVWLKADLSVLARRSVGGDRPLLAGDVEGKIRMLYDRRRGWYEECANLVMHTDGMHPKMIAKAVYAALR
ncbi:MAG: shikimate kinase [Spirochaetia bacterium]|jgi:shikimate kinase|nr:shikimate kinase [Spirochaetia bacterium]